ncbi:MAG: hypothetical protein RLZZ08_1606 [Pseudomonadota bacterium]|jgi:hypothetical protein
MAWQAVSIISLAAWLMLALGAYHSRRVPVGKTLKMAAVWAAIFTLVAELFAAIHR